MKLQISEDSTKFTKIYQLTNGSYYYIRNLANKNKYLTVSKSQNYEKQNVRLESLDKIGLHQIWMIEQVQPDKFEIVHAASTLILQDLEEQIKLRFGKWKNSQLFYVQKSQHDPDSNIFFIKQSKHSKKYLFYENHSLQCQEKPLYHHESNKWDLQLIKEHPLLDETYILQYPISNMVMDLPGASQKQGQKIIQYTVNKRFNQRWYIQKDENNQFYLIKSMKSGMVLEIKDGKKKQGINIVQSPYNHALNQKWVFEEHGKRLYLIRSAMDLNLMITVKGSSIKQCAEIVTTKHQGEAFWRIVGNIIL